MGRRRGGSSEEGRSLPTCVPEPRDGESKPPLHDSDSRTGDLQMSYPKWCALLVSNVLRSRTPFASYLNKTIFLSQAVRSSSLSPAFFPIPVPPGSPFDRMPAGLSQSRRRLQHLRRTVHIVCMALNFWNSGGVFDDELLLQREPSSSHRCLYGRIASLIRSDGLATSFALKKSGRKFPNLIASLGELSEVLTRVGSVSPYEKSFAGIDCTLSDEDKAALTPFRDLDPERLLIRGTGHWDATDYLSDYLVMPYREPLVLEDDLKHGVRPFIRDPASVVASLARKWDDKGLLCVHDECVQPESLVKVFNCFKSVSQDRQIGDRRGRNSIECKVMGPSKLLPSGADISDLFVDPAKEKLVLSVTDRCDFYHQILATKSRAVSNTVGPGIPIEMLEGTKGLSTFLLSQARRRRRREAVGDNLDRFGQFVKRGLHPEPGCVWIGFNSVLQGDHAGVEICTDAHTSLLQEHGLLSHGTRLVASRPLLSQSCLEGLVIDDYFCLSKECASLPNEQSVAYKAYQKAQEAYGKHKLLGSPAKDVLCENEGRAIGAYINSGHPARSRGLVTLSAPPEKRVSLSFITLHLCALSHTSDSLHLCLLGGRVSLLGYRRPLMSLLDRSFHLVDQNTIDQNNPRVIPLPRSVANELVLLAVLMPLMVHELSADYLPHIFATDASSKKGAICRSLVGRDVAEVLWKHCKSKGAYTRLLTEPESFLRQLEIFEEHSDHRVDVGVDRPLAFTSDFIEIFAGSAKVTKYVSFLGVAVGVPIDLSYSPELDLRWQHVMRWLSFLVCERRIKCFAIEPPCTTFSIMRRPRLRSREHPLGFNSRCPKTFLGNTLACRSGQLMYIAADSNVVGLWETPFSSYMKHLPAWKAVLRKSNALEVRCDSCRFGSPHQKSFRFLTVNADARPLARRCVCVERHLKIEGALTKDSAVYTDSLASQIASVLVQSAQAIDRRLSREDSLDSAGLENQLVNEVALSADWEVVDSWTFKKNSHINILEEASLLRLISKLVPLNKSCRVVALVDSFVVRGATSKGRSSSRGLSSVLRRLNALVVAAGIHLVTPFCPTRLNISDDPTRDVALRSPVVGAGFRHMDFASLSLVASHSCLRRWASNWVRLLFLICGPRVFSFKDRSSFRSNRCEKSLALDFSSFDFDSTLGYPGEGPTRVLPVLVWFCLFWVAPFRFDFAPCLLGCCWVLLCFPPVAAMPITPLTAGDVFRARHRSDIPGLPEGRPVLARTGSLRSRYFVSFQKWVDEIGVDLEFLLSNYHENVEEINCLLTRYGRELYRGGRTYNQFAETINELTSRKPPLRRLVQSAWDLGYTWRKVEPSVHHIAMPAMVLLAVLSTCFAWGWTRLAGCFALMWGGLLRPGEMTNATRGDLLLPDDVQSQMPFCLLAVKEPKTRFSNARHQSVKVDVPELLQIIRLAFLDLSDSSFLWPYSAQTLRLRLKQILAALKLQADSLPDSRALDLGSFRAGGATFIIQATEDGDLLQRRGRWANRKMMEIYVQEVSAILYLKRVPDDVRQHVLQVAGAFPNFLTEAWKFKHAKIPENVWYILFSKR